MAEDQEASKIQAVKELIFGTEIKNYEKEFQEIQDHLAEIEQKLVDESNARESAVQQLEKDMEARLDKLEATLTKKIEELEDKKTDRAALGKMLVQIGEKLQAN